MYLTRRPLARDAIAYAASLAALFWAMRGGTVQPSAAAALVAMYAGYLLVVVYAKKLRAHFRGRSVGAQGSTALCKHCRIPQRGRSTCVSQRLSRFRIRS